MFFKEIERRKNLKELINDICETIQKNNIKVSYLFVSIGHPDNKKLSIGVANKSEDGNINLSHMAYSYEQHGFTPPSYPRDFARKLAQQMGLHFEESNQLARDGERHLRGYFLASDEYIQLLEEREMKKNNLRRC